MGSLHLSPSDPLAASEFWSRLPIAPDRQILRSVLAALSSRIAQVRDIAAPPFFGDSVSSEEWAALCASIAPASCTPDLLGATLEVLLSPEMRRSKGAHFTPPHVADTVVGLAVDELDLRSRATAPSVWDPASGGGAFLLAAARRLDEIGRWTRAQIVSQMYASDIDPVALEISGAALWLWSEGTGQPSTHCGDTLLDGVSPDAGSQWPASFDLVVGNPPFLGQLRSETSRGRARRHELSDVFDRVSGGYVDDSGLFLVLALTRLAADGVAALVLPDSIFAARDSRAVREAADELADFGALWVDSRQSFDAAVDVVAPVFIKRTPSAHTDRALAETSVTMGSGRPVRLPRPEPATWSPLLAGARGVPRVRTSSSPRLGERASVTAGFRQHFYGLSGAVREWDEYAARNELRLVTSGAIDPMRLLWGRRPVKFAGSRWNAPVVELDLIEDDLVRSWFDARAVPKLLLATQTRVLEAVVDRDGVLLPSVPVLSLEPNDPEDLWLLAAAVSSPFASAWIAMRNAGSGLSKGSFRVRARELSGLPLPENHRDWLAGARDARNATEASTAGDDDAYVSSMRSLGVSMTAAYDGASHEAMSWWWDRLRMPDGFSSEAY